mmetsp:Transcript_7738/g.24244  ORF Transcript_7738/g.24244 Transcript_7738/m.24244 type:complete len:326 (+) Transcript_7738:517-1494(+)
MFNPKVDIRITSFFASAIAESSKLSICAVSSWQSSELTPDSFRAASRAIFAAIMLSRVSTDSLYSLMSSASFPTGCSTAEKTRCFSSVCLVSEEGGVDSFLTPRFDGFFSSVFFSTSSSSLLGDGVAALTSNMRCIFFGVFPPTTLKMVGSFLSRVLFVFNASKMATFLFSFAYFTDRKMVSTCDSCVTTEAPGVIAGMFDNSLCSYSRKFVQAPSRSRTRALARKNSLPMFLFLISSSSTTTSSLTFVFTSTSSFLMSPSSAFASRSVIFLRGINFPPAFATPQCARKACSSKISGSQSLAPPGASILTETLPTDSTTTVAGNP